MVVCEKGGIRRCLMNLLGNALKFTTVRYTAYDVRCNTDILFLIKDGYVHVTLRQLPANLNAPEGHIKLELGVLDSGKVSYLFIALCSILTLIPS
jgi:signal transduction histidine kinase